MPTSAALDAVATKAKLKFFEVSPHTRSKDVEASPAIRQFSERAARIYRQFLREYMVIQSPVLGPVLNNRHTPSMRTKKCLSTSGQLLVK
jgi:hypothetical protein